MDGSIFYIRCLQMEMLGHTFFMYRDGDTGEIDVVYKRRDGKYGVLEPEG